MITTIDIEYDLLRAARELAARRGVTVGKVISDLARAGLDPTRPSPVRKGDNLVPRYSADAPRPAMDGGNGEPSPGPSPG